MIPDINRYVTEPLQESLREQLNLPMDFEAGRLDVDRVADIAVIASAQTTGFAATGHLLTLLAAVPAPTEDGHGFWADLFRACGTAYLLPANIKHVVLRALDADAAGLAGQILSATGEMTAAQRAAAAEVVGQALVETQDMVGCKARHLGELWLRDLELTAWRVLHADRVRLDLARREAFSEAWKNA